MNINNNDETNKAKKRLNIEITRNYNNNNFDKYKKISHNEYGIIIKNKFNIRIEIIVNKYYPFKPPYISVNEYSYNKLLENRNFSTKLTNDYFKYKLKLKNDFCCIQCNSIIRINMWAPNYGIKEILDEINEIFEVKQKIIEGICVDVICRKYLALYINVNIKTYI